jgi:hypothetical protein
LGCKKIEKSGDTCIKAAFAAFLLKPGETVFPFLPEPALAVLLKLG